MKKIISFVGMFAVLGVAAGDAHGVAMSAQVRRLLQEKQEKIEQLEKCEGKKQGWMIAGISTIGLTAVGVGVNIAQASKSNRLSNEIEMEKTTLQRQQDELDRISNQIADERAKKAEEERKRAEEEQRRRDEREKPRADEEVAGTISEECAKDKIWFPWNDGDKKCYSDEKETSVVSCKCDNIPVVDAAGGQPGQGESQKPSAPQKPVSSATERIVGQDCTVEDLTALHAIRGHYITTGSKTKKCATSAGGALPAENNCSCATQECDTSSGYEMVKGQGWCKYVGKTGGSGQKPAETSKPGQGSSGGSGVATNGQSGGVKAEREQTDMKNKIPELSPISAKGLKSNLISDDKLPPREIPKVSSDIRIANNSDENVGTVDNIMELARYKEYKVQCNGADEKFEFINDVSGADEQILRIKTDCNGAITEKTSSMQYADTSGNTTTHATTVIICKCDKQRNFSVSESGIKKSSSGISGGTSQESKWHILEQANRGYGVTKDYFCNQVQDKSKYIAFTVRADYPNVSALIEQGAGMGYWCKQLDGTWTVERPYGINGREWKCDNLDAVKSQCNEKPVIENNKDIELQIPSWFSFDELRNPTRDPNYWSSSSACERIKYSNSGSIGISQSLLTLKDKYEYALGAGYWCKQFNSEWSVNVSEDGSLVEWKCEIDKLKCPQDTEATQVNDSGNRDGHANRELAESILEQTCDSVEKNPMPFMFEYYCVGTTQRKCEKLKTEFESVGLPAPEVEFKAEIEEQSWPSGTRIIKKVCVVRL